MIRNKNDLNNNNNDADKYLKRNFWHRIPFGLKATFIKYWFYGALYFFCFMGLGFYLQNENLVLVTGAIGGVLFDLALYNIYLLMAETREEASKWWIFKSKKFYSIFINVIVLIALFFVFYLIVVPINMVKPANLDWLFQEPLTAALLLTVLDTIIVWIKNLLVMLYKKYIKHEKKGENKGENLIKILDITPISVSIELNNKDICQSNKAFDVYLNNEVIFKKINKNSLTIYDLMPDTQYHITINRQNVVFTTPRIYKAYKVYEGNDIQKVIDTADQYSLIIINKGTYPVKSLLLKNNLVIYLRKGATLLASPNEEDYPIIPATSAHNEVYGNYKGVASEMRQSIIHLDHVKNVKIVGEGVIDAQGQLSPAWKKGEFKVIPPHLIYINHSSDISIIGLTLKNSPQWTIHPFFSENINLINLDIANDLILTDGITPQCSSIVNIIGCHLHHLDNCVAIKSGRNDIARIFMTPSKNIAIRNCVMDNSRCAVSFGSETSSGIRSVNISRSSFHNVNHGILVKTRRGNGKEAIIKDVNVSNINMNEVLTPIAINMFDKTDLAGEANRILSKKHIPIDANTPYLDNFSFTNIFAKNYHYAAGYFYGLPEKFIYEIKITDSTFIAKDECEEGIPIDVDGVDKCRKCGFILRNIRSINLKNVRLEHITGKRLNIEDVSETVDEP